MTNMGGNGIRRAQKVERRRNRKQKRHGVAAGVARRLNFGLTSGADMGCWRGVRE